MSYRVYGLGVEPEGRPEPWYVALLSKIADPLSAAAAQRIAYGKTQPGAAGQFYPAPPPPAPLQASILGGVSPTTLLLGAAALVAVMMLRK